MLTKIGELMGSEGEYDVDFFDFLLDVHGSRLDRLLNLVMKVVD